MYDSAAAEQLPDYVLVHECSAVVALIGKATQ